MRTYLKNTEIKAGIEMGRKEVMDQGMKMVSKRGRERHARANRE